MGQLFICIILISNCNFYKEFKIKESYLQTTNLKIKKFQIEIKASIIQKSKQWTNYAHAIDIFDNANDHKTIEDGNSCFKMVFISDIKNRCHFNTEIDHFIEKLKELLYMFWKSHSYILTNTNKRHFAQRQNMQQKGNLNKSTEN